VASKYLRSELSRLQDLGYRATSCLPDKNCSMGERRVIDIWCGLEQSTINMAIDHYRRRLRACIHLKGEQLEHNL